MGTSVKPVQEAPPTDPNNNNSDPPNSDGPPNWALALAKDAEHERTKRENEELRQRLNQQQPIQQPPLPTLQPGEPFQDPNKFVDVLGQLVARQIKPLQDELDLSRKERVYTNLKQRVKAANPGLVQIFGQIEGAVDIEMQGKEPTEQNLISSIKVVVGHIALTNPQAFAQRASNNPDPNNPPKPNNNNPNPSNMQQPPHLLPSNRSTITDPNEPKTLDLTQFDENERRLMREKGLTPRQFIALRDTPNHLMTKELYNKIKTDPEYKKP